MSRKSVLETEYEDILRERRTGSDVRWAAREWEETVTYKYRKKMKNKSEFFEQILRSDRVNHTINKLVSEGQSRKALENKVNFILEDMCHALNIGMIRKFAVTLPKIMKRIYDKILVNTAGIEAIKSVTGDTPVIFLPTHRSYADFLLISYITFHYNIPFPVIAAGMDFMSMVVVGDMLRGAGAFYIRRSFMDDSLYWALFQEYVQSLICDSGQPMEFFLEGTRSRSGKSLPPKLGLLGCVVECWLRGKVPDIAIVPISVSYNRTLEEKLYAYEMLGVPKPKESTSGLLKAMKILKESFGNIYVHIGHSVSIRDILSPSVDRHLTVVPYHLAPLTSEELNGCERVALRVIRNLQLNCVVSIWSLACVALQRALWGNLWSLSFQTLYRETLVLARLAMRLGAVVEGGDSSESIEQHLKRSLEDHKETAVLSVDGVVHIQKLHRENETFSSNRNREFALNPSTVENAVTHLLIQYYVNQVLHLFIRPALVALVLRDRTHPTCSYGELRARFASLVPIFSFDFIFEKERLAMDLDEAVHFLTAEGCVERRGNEVCIVEPVVNAGGSFLCEQKPFSEFLTDVIKPFLLTYQVALNVAGSRSSWKNESLILESIRAAVEERVDAHSLYSSLSLDLCRQTLKMLIKMEALSKERSLNGVRSNGAGNGDGELTSNESKISVLRKLLQPQIFFKRTFRSKL